MPVGEKMFLWWVLFIYYVEAILGFCSRAKCKFQKACGGLHKRLLDRIHLYCVEEQGKKNPDLSARIGMCLFGIRFFVVYASASGITDTTLLLFLPLWKFTTPSTRANRVSSLPIPTLLPGLWRVPRWRTIMLPATHFWPPQILTPNLCEADSRPFLELPTPFLCAISKSS